MTKSKTPPTPEESPPRSLADVLLDAPRDEEFTRIMDEIIESRGFGPLSQPLCLDTIAKALAKLDDAQLSQVRDVVQAERQRREGASSC